MKTFEVAIPIAGHAFKTVRAESEEAAISAAFDEVEHNDIYEWEPLERFTQGNVCYCPQPWEVEAVEVGSSDDDEPTA